MTQPDKLTIEDCETIIKFLDGMPGHEIIPTYRQLADTMRENESLRDALRAAATVLENCGMGCARDDCLRALESPNKDSEVTVKITGAWYAPQTFTDKELMEMTKDGAKSPEEMGFIKVKPDRRTVGTLIGQNLYPHELPYDPTKT